MSNILLPLHFLQKDIVTTFDLDNIYKKAKLQETKARANKAEKKQN